VSAGGCPRVGKETVFRLVLQCEKLDEKVIYPSMV